METKIKRIKREEALLNKSIEIMKAKNEAMSEFKQRRESHRALLNSERLRRHNELKNRQVLI